MNRCFTGSVAVKRQLKKSRLFICHISLLYHSTWSASVERHVSQTAWKGLIRIQMNSAAVLCDMRADQPQDHATEETIKKNTITFPRIEWDRHNQATQAQHSHKSCFLRKWAKSAPGICQICFWVGGSNSSQLDIFGILQAASCWLWLPCMYSMVPQQMQWSTASPCRVHSTWSHLQEQRNRSFFIVGRVQGAQLEEWRLNWKSALVILWLGGLAVDS